MNNYSWIMLYFGQDGSCVHQKGLFFQMNYNYRQDQWLFIQVFVFCLIALVIAGILPQRWEHGISISNVF